MASASKVVILTGGIAAGKTAVTERFATRGVPIIDTDVLAREVVAPGSPGLQQLVALAGADIVDHRGALKRRLLRQRIMADGALRQAVEQTLHPLIEALARQRIAQASGPYCIVAVPLYVESGRFQWADRIVVVDVPTKVQIQRLMARDEMTAEQAAAMLRAQASRQQRLAVADDIIDNSGSLADLDQRIAELHQKYLAEFAAAPSSAKP